MPPPQGRRPEWRCRIAWLCLKWQTNVQTHTHRRQVRKRMRGRSAAGASRSAKIDLQEARRCQQLNQQPRCEAPPFGSSGGLQEIDFGRFPVPPLSLGCPCPEPRLGWLCRLHAMPRHTRLRKPCASRCSQEAGTTQTPRSPLGGSRHHGAGAANPGWPARRVVTHTHTHSTRAKWVAIRGMGRRQVGRNLTRLGLRKVSSITGRSPTPPGRAGPLTGMSSLSFAFAGSVANPGLCPVQVDGGEARSTAPL